MGVDGAVGLAEEGKPLASQATNTVARTRHTSRLRHTRIDGEVGCALPDGRGLRLLSMCYFRKPHAGW
jgi:hypothetical protein